MEGDCLRSTVEPLPALLGRHDDYRIYFVVFQLVRYFVLDYHSVVGVHAEGVIHQWND